MHGGYYLIRPKEELVKQIAALELDTAWRDYLTNVSVWQGPERGYTSVSWEQEEAVARSTVKAVFLADLLHSSEVFLEKRADPTLSNIILKLLGSPKYSIEIFDKWWSIEPVTVGWTIEYILGIVPPTIFGKLQSEEKAIEQWLSDIADHSDSKISDAKGEE